MDNVKKVLVAAGAVMALGAQAQQQFPTEPAGAADGYGRMTSDLFMLCNATQPFKGTGDPAWTCAGGVDQGITVGPRPEPTGTAAADV